VAVLLQWPAATVQVLLQSNSAVTVVVLWRYAIRTVTVCGGAVTVALLLRSNSACCYVICTVTVTKTGLCTGGVTVTGGNIAVTVTVMLW
jgi:hypothetical protein